jgi:type II secretory pathway pseudopilin PulG
MPKTKQDFSLMERLMVVAILLLLAVIAAQNVLLSVRESEEQTVKNATVEYATVRRMYTAQNQVAPSVGFGPGVGGSTAPSNSSIH